MGPEIALAFSVLSAVGGAYSQIQQASQARAAGKIQAAGIEMENKQLELQMDAEKTRVMQEEANRKARLNEILGGQMAMTAGRGVQIGSGSDLAIAQFSEEEAMREAEMGRSDSNYRQALLGLEKGQNALRKQGALLSAKSTAQGHYAKGAQTLFQGGVDYYDKKTQYGI
jgi:hypothetical protein